MAPDLDSLTQDGRWDYSAPGSSGYNVPDIAYNDPYSRKMRVITIGAGFSGILAAYQIQKQTENVELAVYEKNPDLGGTWLENRFPGCACDSPAHGYTYNFALNPDWPHLVAEASEFCKYLEKVVKVFDLRKYMTFNTEVVHCEWQEEVGKWKVKLRQTSLSGETTEFEDECDMLLFAKGVLNTPKWPKVEGFEKFKGRVVHTAAWPQNYQKEQWANERVAVLGSGSSSIQTVPGMQPYVKHMDVFVRTPTWFLEIVGYNGNNKDISQEERDEFRKNPQKMVDHAKWIEAQQNGLWKAFLKGTPEQEMVKGMLEERMKKLIKDERLLKGFTPKFAAGCRRLVPGDPYIVAVQKENVNVHFTAAAEFTEKGVIGEDGIEREVDTIICATGFDTSYRPRFPVIGKNGVSLSQKWKDVPEGYLGLASPDMPNFITFIGPTWPIINGSVVGPLQSVAEYAVQMIKKMQRDHIKSWVPKQEMTDQFNAHAQEMLKHTVWSSDCRSWYKNNDTGRINSIWPGSSNHYIEVVATPRYEDFEIKYLHGNPWAHLGMGAALCNVDFPNADVSPWLAMDKVDPKWLAATGCGSA